MRGLALGDDGEAADGLAGGLESALRPKRGFKYEGAVGVASDPANRTRGPRAAHFLVGVEQHDRSERKRQLELMDCPQCEHHVHQPGLHVQHAGTAHGVRRGRDGHLLERADRPDGVAMAQQQLSAVPRSRAAVRA